MLPGVEATAVVAAFNLERVHKINRGGVEPPEGGTMLASADWQTFFPITITKRLKT